MSHVPFAQRHIARWISRWPALGPRAAAAESTVLRDAIAAFEPGPPVWICGMARAGSTILLEVLNDAPGFTAHQYGDYPWLWTPYWRNWLRERLPGRPQAARERAHADRLRVTPSSPEAFEEVFWMHFFKNRHDPETSQVLDRGTSNPAFERFLDEHHRKLLFARGANRYLGKANYQLARLGYLHRLFPAARFVIPVREPLAQVHSLIRQDLRFRRLHADDAAVGLHLARIGHFEFGPQKRAFHLGDAAVTRAIAEDFAAGRTASAYARQWAAQYGFAARCLAADAGLADACLWVGYERLCADPTMELERIGRHVGLSMEDATTLARRWAGRISAPPRTAADLEDAAVTAIGDIAMPVWSGLQPLLDRPADR